MSNQMTLFADPPATKYDQVVAIAREYVTKTRGCDAADRDLYKRAFEEVCHQFNFGDEKDYEDMRDAFLRIVGEGYEGRGNYERD